PILLRLCHALGEALPAVLRKGFISSFDAANVASEEVEQRAAICSLLGAGQCRKEAPQAVERQEFRRSSSTAGFFGKPAREVGGKSDRGHREPPDIMLPSFQLRNSRRPREAGWPARRP